MRGGRGRLRGVSPSPSLTRRGGGSAVRTFVPGFVPPAAVVQEIGADTRPYQGVNREVVNGKQ